jgi:dienelactone hydrolase
MRLRRLGIALAVVLVALVAWEPTRVGIQTAVLIPNLLDAGPRVLDTFSDDPRRSTIPYRAAPDGGEAAGDLAELWLPAWASADQPAGAMLLVFGVNNLGRNHPSIERVADGLARSGVAVLVPDSRTLLGGRLELEEIDGVVRAFQTLAARPEVDRERMGIVGFSVGGSLALLAAGDARISEEVAWVNAFGAYADARTYLASVASHSYTDGGGRSVAWQPTPLALEVFLRFALEQVSDDGDRTALEAAYAEDVLAGIAPSPRAEVRSALGSEAGRAIHDLLTAATSAEAVGAIERLPSSSLAFIDAISPVRHVGDLRADVYLMHEVEDHHVPVVESRALADALGPLGHVRRHTEFRLFDHVQPDDLDLVAAAPEVVRLLLHVRELMQETL